MEPRGCVGDHSPAEDRYTAYASLQRLHGFRADLAFVLRIAESKLRVVSGDVGGSFGMKTALYNETVLCLLAARRLGRPVKWISTRSEAFLSDAQARDNVTDAELALDKDGIFLSPARAHISGNRRVSAGRNAEFHAQYRNCGRRLPDPCDFCRACGRVHAYQSGAALSG